MGHYAAEMLGPYEPVEATPPAGFVVTPDYQVMTEVKAKAKYITAKEGGHGAVREAIEYILKQDGRWQAAVADYEKELYAQGQ